MNKIGRMCVDVHCYLIMMRDYVKYYNCKKEKCIYKYIKYNNLYIKFMKYLYEELSDNIKSIGNNFWINLL